MRVLMLGNSLTAANHMPQRLAELLDAEVSVHARGGARLAEQFNPNTKLGARTVQALQEHCYDYVVLQEMSHGPATAPDRYKDSVRKLAGMIRDADAEPVLYATWAFRPGCEKLTKFCTAVYLSLYAFDMTVSYFICKKLLDKVDEMER